MTDQPSPYDPGSKPPRTGVGVEVHDLVKEWRNRATILERQVKDFEAEAFKMCDERNKAEEQARCNAAQRDAIARQLEEALWVIELKESRICSFSDANVTLHKRLAEAEQEKLRAQAGQSKSADFWMDRANSLEKDKIEARAEALRLREVLVTIAGFDKDRHPQCPHWCGEQAREAQQSPNGRVTVAQESQTRRVANEHGINWPYTRQAAIDRINSQPDPLVADPVAIIDLMMKKIPPSQPGTALTEIPIVAGETLVSPVIPVRHKSIVNGGNQPDRSATK